MMTPRYCRQLTNASNPDMYPECWQTGGGDNPYQPLGTAEVTTLQIPGIHRNPGGFVTDQEELLRLAMGGTPGPARTPSPATGGVPDKTLVYVLGAAAVVAIVLMRRNG